MKKRFLAILMAVVFVVATPMMASATTRHYEEKIPRMENRRYKDFVDVPYRHWAKGWIEYAYEHGLMDSVSKDTFAPNVSVTVGEVMEAYVRICDFSDKYIDVSEAYRFADVNDDTEAAAVAVFLAIDSGGYYGYKDEAGRLVYGLDQPATRGFVAEILGAQSEIYYDKHPREYPKTTFWDIKGLSQNSRERIMFLKQMGVLSGYGDDSFRPDNTVTRAEFATMISKRVNLAENGVLYSEYYKL